MASVASHAAQRTPAFVPVQQFVPVANPNGIVIVTADVSQAAYLARLAKINKRIGDVWERRENGDICKE
jgi:hypothetical protein